MSDTDVFLQLEKQGQRTPRPRQRTVHEAGGQHVTRKPAGALRARIKPAAKPMPSPPPHGQAGAQRPLREDSRAHRAPTNKAGQDPAAAAGRHDVMTEAMPDVNVDVTTSVLQGVNKKLWREQIEETETHNSSLRLSEWERQQVEDAVRDLKRQYRIKTSMNEIARLGLLFFIHDFRQRGQESIIAAVKTS